MIFLIPPPAIDLFEPSYKPLVSAAAFITHVITLVVLEEEGEDFFLFLQNTYNLQ